LLDWPGGVPLTRLALEEDDPTSSSLLTGFSENVFVPGATASKKLESE